MCQSARHTFQPVSSFLSMEPMPLQIIKASGLCALVERGGASPKISWTSLPWAVRPIPLHTVPKRNCSFKPGSNKSHRSRIPRQAVRTIRRARFFARNCFPRDLSARGAVFMRRSLAFTVQSGVLDSAKQSCRKKTFGADRRLVELRALCNDSPRTPPGPEGSNGSGSASCAAEYPKFLLPQLSGARQWTERIFE